MFLLRALAVLILARFLLLSNVWLLQTLHPVQSFSVLQNRPVVLEPADNVGASQACLGLQLAVLLWRGPLGPTEHLCKMMGPDKIFQYSTLFTFTLQKKPKMLYLA